MGLLIALCGFVGAWLLFAGPVLQAALELAEEEIEFDSVAEAGATVPRPDRISPWWWLLPPVGYLLERRRARTHRKAVFEALPPDTMRQFVSYLDKATGWLLVAGGALLIAVKETAELGELLELPVWAVVVLIIVAAIVAASYTVARMRRRHGLLGEERPARRRGPRRASTG